MDPTDSLAIHSLTEDPARWEAMILAEIERSRTDPAARAVIESIYCDEDREAAFARFARGPEIARIAALLDDLGVSKDARICEIGGGAGWLGWALHHRGYRRLSMLEPNDRWVSGTGYLRTRADAGDIRIWNDLATFYADPGRYDLVLTHNCVHHFRGIGYVAAAIRQKIAARGRWLMLREWFADSAEELYRRLRDHPYSQRYGLFEFPYPASHYVEAVELSGFTLTAVVPAGYANGLLDGTGQDEGSARTRIRTRVLDEVLSRAPSATVRAYRAELFANRYLGRQMRRYTRPQAMLFTRRELA